MASETLSNQTEGALEHFNISNVLDSSKRANDWIEAVESTKENRNSGEVKVISRSVS
jgi:hypothetical protein